ncbi:hypothetical protein BDP27DRAFT_1411371 [Rhodocollybia butyracea]|uniref:Uncharacterized protein n=1 Tax=Rhodocollybia butyracea TaxID=206335 RepID=A0A9P5TWI3_9AGAR|nr:hypothetical protein BDP27DRAFT_1411371 [Rhodocollybia butyracea]
MTRFFAVHAAALCVTDLEPYEFRVVALCVTELPVVIVHCKLPDVITLHWYLPQHALDVQQMFDNVTQEVMRASGHRLVRSDTTHFNEPLVSQISKDDFSSPGLKVSAENFAKRLEGYTISGVQEKKLAAFIKSKPRRQKVLFTMTLLNDSTSSSAVPLK